MASLQQQLAQIETKLLKILADCMNEVAGKANQLLRKHVDEDVYDVGTQMGREYYYNNTGEPTHQLRESVTNDPSVVVGNEVQAKIYHNTNKMGYDADTFLHGSNYFSPSDVREMLPYLIDQGKTGGLFGSKWEGLMRPYMTNTREELRNGLLKKWMIEALKKRGIKVG